MHARRNGGLKREEAPRQSAPPKNGSAERADTTPAFGAREGGLAWLPVYVGDWLKATRGWSLVERGIYFELLLLQWDDGAIPADPEALRAIVRATAEEWAAAWPVVATLFPRRGRRRRNPDLTATRARQEKRHKSFSDGGRYGNEKRWAEVRAQRQKRGEDADE